MILFSVVTAALIFIALILLLRPLLTNNARGAALTVAMLVPLSALALYFWLGSPALIQGTPQQTAASSHGDGAMTMEKAIAMLEQKLEQNPDNAEGWYMLARSYIVEQQYGNAVKAMERMFEIEGKDDPRLLLQYADAMAMSNDGRVAGKPAEVVQRALELEPDFPEALWLAGIAESQEGNLAESIVYWRKAVALLADQPEAQAELRAQLKQAEDKLQAMGGTLPEAPSTSTEAASTAPSTPTSAQPTAAPAAIKVSVSLDPSLANKANPDDSVFIYARAASGPPMPLAATRAKVRDLPVTVTLDDSMAMMPQMKLSSFPEVIVGARISKSGQALPQPGDLEGTYGPVSSQKGGEVDIKINRVR